MVAGYLIEYESPSPVPAPSTILLFGTGVLGLATINRQKSGRLGFLQYPTAVF
jgi:hypothetical protein